MNDSNGNSAGSKLGRRAVGCAVVGIIGACVVPMLLAAIMHVDTEHSMSAMAEWCARAGRPGDAYNAASMRAEAQRLQLHWLPDMADRDGQPGVTRDEAIAMGMPRVICEIRHREGRVVSTRVSPWYW